MKKIISLIISILLFYSQIIAQEKFEDIELSGYMTNMQSVMFQDVKENWILDNLLHNRLNFHYYPINNLTLALEFRTRLLTGESVKYQPNYAKGIDTDNGWIDMSWNIANDSSFVLNTTLDRAYLKFEKGDFSITAGRQRINWGQTFVWNSNDIFNNYSFFEFDYVERPGSDALRLEYYPSYTSKAEMAVKVNSQDKITAAGLYRFNKWQYDFQVLGGILNQQDYVIGTGWSGGIFSTSFRGEVTYLHPREQFEDTTGLWFVGLSSDYTFQNSLMIQFEALYMDIAKNQQISGFNDFYSQPLSVKNLSFAEYNFFGQCTYPVTPLINTTIAIMYMPQIEGYYTGPTVDISLKDNLSLSLVLQYFSGKFENQQTQKKEQQNFTLAFIRLKGAF